MYLKIPSYESDKSQFILFLKEFKLLYTKYTTIKHLFVRGGRNTIKHFANTITFLIDNSNIHGPFRKKQD